MEKSHISDFSLDELIIFEDFIKNFNTIEGLEYNLAVLKIDKEFNLGMEWPAYSENQKEKNDNYGKAK